MVYSPFHCLAQRVDQGALAGVLLGQGLQDALVVGAL